VTDFAGLLETVFFPSYLSRNLRAAIHQSGQFLLKSCGFRAGLDVLFDGKTQNHLSIDGIGFGFYTLAFCEGADPRRVEDPRGDFRFVKVVYEMPFVTASGFANDQRVLEFLYEFEQLGEALRRGGHSEGVGVCFNLQGVFGDIDSDDLEWRSRHGFSRSCRGELKALKRQRLGQLFEIKPGTPEDQSFGMNSVKPVQGAIHDLLWSVANSVAIGVGDSWLLHL
jgi:hypothetical protein